MAATERSTWRVVTGWVIRCIFLWMAVGAGFGLIGINAIAPNFPPLGGSMNWYVAAEMYSPLIGAAWGLVAGVIGSLIGVIFRSGRGYTWTLVTLAVVPYLPFLAEFVQRGIPVLSAVLVLVAGLTGVAAWWVAKRNGPPPREASTT